MTTRRVVVAIDGAAGSGKSTLARRLAADLDVPYVNTGSMYRALTARALGEGLDLDDGFALAELARRLRFDLDLTEHPPVLIIDGAPGGEALLAPEVETSVSAASRHPQVRAVMVEAQRRLGADGAVMEGRDIGSVVFPDADLKIFLDASPDERVRRRAAQRDRTVASEIATRDRRDARVNPFVPAPGAVRIDTTGRSPDEVHAEALRRLHELAGIDVDG